MFASEQIWIKTVLDLKCFKIGLVLMLNVKKYIFCLFTRNLHRASCCGILLRSVTCGQIFQSMPLTQDWKQCILDIFILKTAWQWNYSPPPLQQQGPRLESGSYIEPSFLGRVSSVCVGSVMDSGFLTKSTYLVIIVGRNVSMNDYLSLC